MIAQVIPITRLRRATDWWSYKLPSGIVCVPGSLVVIPFRGHDTLGVVWEIEKEDRHATLVISRVITPYSLVHAPHRRFIEWLAEEGICSLSTALHQWLPAALRSLPLTKPVQALLADHQPAQISSPQQLVLTPGKRDHIGSALQKKVKSRFLSFFQEESDTEECRSWLAVASGEKTIGLGRERALFAPWHNLQQVIIQEPEDVSYYHEQIPYLNLVQAAQVLAKYSNADCVIRTRVPYQAATLLWGTGVQQQEVFTQLITYQDLRREKLLNEALLTAIKECVSEKKEVVILYNVKDRLIEKEGEKVLLPGVQTMGKQLAHTLGYTELPPGIHFGTRAILATVYENVGLTVILSIDPLLGQEHFADQVHGWGDIGHLLSYAAPCIVQGYQSSDPLTQALRNDSFAEYCLQQVEQQKEQQFIPFAEAILCSYPIEKEPTPSAEHLQKTLAESAPPTWAISHPFAIMVRKKEQQAILLHAAAGTRLPAPLRKVLAKLARPWKVQHNPWFTI